LGALATWRPSQTGAIAFPLPPQTARLQLCLMLQRFHRPPAVVQRTLSGMQFMRLLVEGLNLVCGQNPTHECQLTDLGGGNLRFTPNSRFYLRPRLTGSLMLALSLLYVLLTIAYNMEEFFGPFLPGILT